MRSLIIFFIVIIFASCSNEKLMIDTGEKYKVPKELGSFIRQFELSTNNHNKEQLSTLLDKAYKEQVYNGLSKHEKDHFFRVFFCGKDTISGQGVCPAFIEIDRIEFKSISQNNDGTYTVQFIIYTIYEVLHAKWKITVNENNEKTIFGIIPDFK